MGHFQGSKEFKGSEESRFSRALEIFQDFQNQDDSISYLRVSFFPDKGSKLGIADLSRLSV